MKWHFQISLRDPASPSIRDPSLHHLSHRLPRDMWEADPDIFILKRCLYVLCVCLTQLTGCSYFPVSLHLSNQMWFQDRKRLSSFETCQDTHSPSFPESRFGIPWLHCCSGFCKARPLFSKESAACASRIRPWESPSVWPIHSYFTELEERWRREQRVEDKKKIAVCRWQLKMRSSEAGRIQSGYFIGWWLALRKVSSHVGEAEWAEDHGTEQAIDSVNTGFGWLYGDYQTKLKEVGWLAVRSLGCEAWWARFFLPLASLVTGKSFNPSMPEHTIQSTSYKACHIQNTQ